MESKSSSRMVRGIIWNAVNETTSVSERRVNSIAKSVDKILRMVLMLISRRCALLVSARWASLIFFHDHLRVFVTRAENDIYHEHNYVS